MSTLARIERLSRWLRRATLILTLALPALTVGWLVWGLSRPDWLIASFPGLPQGTVLTGAKSTAVIALGAVGLLPVLFTLARMHDLFGRYGRGEILPPACARAIGHSGMALVVLALWQVLALPLQVLVLTADNPPGGRPLAFALNSEMMWLALAGGLLIAIGMVMAEAARIAEDQAGFV